MVLFDGNGNDLQDYFHLIASELSAILTVEFK